MQALLMLSVFSVVLTRGAFLECKFCLGNSSGCEGTKKMCPPNGDTCAMRFYEHNLGGISELYIAKYCEVSSNCEHNNIFLNIGKGRIYRSRLICCGEEDCPEDIPDLLPEDQTPNGKQCPGCVASSATCKSEMVNCTGSGLHCFHVTTHSREGGEDIYATLKGCSSSSFCVQIKRKNGPFLEGIEKATCSPEVSKGTQYIAFLLQTFSGILMMMMIIS